MTRPVRVRVCVACGIVRRVKSKSKVYGDVDGGDEKSPQQLIGSRRMVFFRIACHCKQATTHEQPWTTLTILFYTCTVQGALLRREPCCALALTATKRKGEAKNRTQHYSNPYWPSPAAVARHLHYTHTQATHLSHGDAAFRGQGYGFVPAGARGPDRNDQPGWALLHRGGVSVGVGWMGWEEGAPTAGIVLPCCPLGQDT